MQKLACFRSYDVRGKIGEELNEGIAYRIGRACAQSLKAETVVLGFDARETSPSLARAVAKGICDAGADVLKIGLCGTEEVYFAVSEFKASAGIEITASHNPVAYNGMKIVKYNSQPLSNQEFASIKYVAEKSSFIPSVRIGEETDIKDMARQAYIDKVLLCEFVKTKPLKIIINSGNGAAGPTIDTELQT